MRISILTSFAAMIMMGCSVIPVQDIPPLSSFGHDPALEWSHAKMADCPDIQGVYQHDYSSFGIEGGSPIRPDKSNIWLTNLVGRYSGAGIKIPTEENPWDRKADELVSRDTFAFANQTAGQFQFIGYLVPEHHDIATLLRKTFSRSKGHYSCEGGLIELPRQERLHGYQGSTVNRQSSVYLGKLNNGSLVLYEQWGPWKKTVSKGSNDIRHEFYVFPPVKQ